MLIRPTHTRSSTSPKKMHSFVASFAIFSPDHPELNAVCTNPTTTLQTVQVTEFRLWIWLSIRVPWVPLLTFWLRILPDSVRGATWPGGTRYASVLSGLADAKPNGPGDKTRTRSRPASSQSSIFILADWNCSPHQRQSAASMQNCCHAKNTEKKIIYIYVPQQAMFLFFESNTNK